MIGMLLRRPSRFKPVPRPRINTMTRALSATRINLNYRHTSYSTTLAPIVPLKDCDSVISCPDVVKVPERVEQIQLTQTSDDVLHFVPRLSEPQILMRPWISVSASQEDRPIQPQYTQFPVFHATPYQEQHIPVYEHQLTVPALPIAPEVLMDRPQPHLDTLTFQQQQLSDDMDVDFDCPQSLMHRPQQYSSSTTESASSACSQFYPPQNQFTNASQSQFTNAMSGFSSSGRSFSYGPPVVLQSTWAPLSTDRREEFSLPSPREPFPVSSCAPERTSSYPPPAAMALVAATPYVGFSQQPAPANSTCSSQAECISTGDMSLDVNHDVSQPVFADHALMLPIDQNHHQPQTLPVSSSDRQSEVPRPSSPVDTAKAKGEMATSVTDLEVTNAMNGSRRQT